MLESWGDSLEPHELRSRRTVYHTLIGVETIRSRGEVAAGLKEILLQGSLAFLARGAMSHFWRRYVRSRRPYS